MSAHAVLAAATPPARAIQALGGHSGAALILCEEAGRSVVRKTAAAPAANLRLRQQAIKQRLLAAQGFAFPAVRRIAADDTGRAFFEMDYVPARTLAEVVTGAVPCSRDAIMDAVAGLVRAFAALSASAIPAAAFRDKIESIAAAAPGNLAVAGIARDLLARDWSDIPRSPDHGDLTLENILLTPDQSVVFIDCDVAWTSSWWLDLAKLFQDLEGHWCLRAVASPSIDALERLRLFASDFRRLAHELDPALPPRLAQLAALHLLRTLPYAKDAATVAFASAAAQRLLRASS
ncbi:MAG: hypothetical protein WDN03_02855 [Rhizomicrobium sp.]